MGDFLKPEDFPDIDDAATLIDDAESLAMLSAPCLAGDLEPYKFKAARAIMRGAILRWSEAGTGVAAQVNAGPFAMTTTSQVRRNAYWPSEIADLQKVCKGADAGKAYSIDTAQGYGASHVRVCAINMGGAFCSCGASLIGGGPLWELDA